MKVSKMYGNRIFPVICGVISLAQLLFAQHPFRMMRPSPSPTSWSIANEIFGSSGGPAFRPPPGVLISGHGPPVARPRGPVRAGSRLIPIFSTSTPSPSSWPSQGPQIQRAHETSHFEYEVFPHPMNQRKPQPPRPMRPAQPVHFRSPVPTHHPAQPVHFRSPVPTHHPAQPVHFRSPVPTHHPAPIPPELLRILAHDGVGPVPSPKPTSRTDRPPLMGLGNPPRRLPPSSNADFQEGFRILSDLFMQDPTGADIRNNLVGGSGSEISFNGNYYPIASINAATASRGNGSASPPLKKPVSPPPTPAVEIAKANEHTILIPAESSPLKEIQPNPPMKLTPSPPTPNPQMQQSESSYGPPQWSPGPPSHVSFMFQDPNEGLEPYNLYDNEYGGPPPPFHSGGNTIIPPPPSLHEPNENDGDGYQTLPGQKSPESDDGGYTNPPPDGNSLRSHTSSSQMPLMMMPIPMPTEGKSDNQPPPTSEEVQRALSVLSRYASQQAASGMNLQPMAMQLTSPNTAALKQMTMPMQQSTPVPSSSITPPPETPGQTRSIPGNTDPMQGYTSPMQGPSSHYSTTENSNTITISAGGQSEESSPQPQYGAPGNGLNMGNNGWGSSGNDGGYQGENRGSSGNTGGYQGMNSVSSGNDGGSGGGSSGGYGEGNGWSQDGGGGSGGGGGAGDIIGAKVQALKTIQSAVTGGFRQITGLKTGILNAGLNAIGNLGKAKGELADSLKIPIVPAKTSYGPPEATSEPPSASSGMGWSTPKPEGPVRTLIKGVRGIVGGIAGTAAQTGRAAVGIGLSNNEFVKNHFAIKGQLFTETVSKKIQNQNQYFQNVLKHVSSIFAQARKPGEGSGWTRR